MPRDTIKEKEYFDAFIEEETDTIIQFQNDVRDGKVAENRINAIYEKIHQLRLEILIAKYSRGDSVEELKPIFDVLWKRWDEVFDPLFYSKIVQMISLAVLFNIDACDIQNKVKRYFEAGSYDWLIKYLSIADRVAGKEIDLTMYLKTYKTLQEMVMEDQVNSQGLKKYLAKWYQRHSGCGWYNTHKYEDMMIYCGYWSFEAGAVAKIFGIDDEELKENKYYPYDLVHF